MPEPDGSTSGTNVEPAPSDGGEASCGRGVVVVETIDFNVNNVALVGLDGAVLSESFISSATSSAGAELPVGDLILPAEPALGEQVVLLDRDASEILWVDVETTEMQKSLSVATGFWSNPHDYLTIDESKAYVTRYRPNGASGSEPFDTGNDVLVVDPSRPAIVGSIDMRSSMQADGDRVLPRPDRLARVGDRVLVLLGAISENFSEYGSVRLAAVDPESDSVEEVLVLEGARNCADTLVPSPNGDEVAIFCAGTGALDGVALEDSAIVRVRVQPRLQEIERHPATDFGDSPVAYYGAYSSEGTLVFETWGVFEDDRLIELSLTDGTHRVLLSSAPYALGQIQCIPECGLCFVADAGPKGGVLHRFELDARGRMGESQAIVVERFGLPPRYVGRF